MKNKVFGIVSALSAFAITQLLFYWLVPMSSKGFTASYPFYTALTAVHLAATVYINNKYGLPSSAAPTVVGSVITLCETAASISLCLLCRSIRTVIFVNSIIVVFYIAAMAFFLGMCSNESLNNNPTVSEEDISDGIIPPTVSVVPRNQNGTASRIPRPNNK